MKADLRNTILVLVLFLALQPINTHSCLNEKGQQVEWFVALRITGPADPRRYAIFDSLDSSSWRETTETILAKQLLDQVDARLDLVAAWNDEPPNGHEVSITHAHAKGVLTFNVSKNSGFYYMHSIPKYPDIDETTGKINYVSPISSQYGQSMICHTIPSQSKSVEILEQVTQSYPFVYFNNFSSKLSQNAIKTGLKVKEGAKLGLAKSLLKSLFKNGQKAESSLKFAELAARLDIESNTIGGELADAPITQKLGIFTFVTKPKPLQTEIFEGFLSPFWQTLLKVPVGFYIETWGRPLIPSQCSGDSQMVNIRTLRIAGTQQLETQDHSKWAISTDRNLSLVCIGDLNHQDSQAKRGGSFMCIQNSTIYKRFEELIVDHDCSGENQSNWTGPIIY